MSEFLKNLIYGLAGVVATSLIAFLWQGTSDRADIVANYSQTRLGGAVDLNDEELRKNASTITSIFETDEAIKFIRNISSFYTSRDFSAVAVQIKNNGSKRASELEIYMSGAIAARISSSGPTKNKTILGSDKLSKLSLDPLNPDDVVNIYFISNLFFADKPDIKLIHEGRKVDVFPTQFDRFEPFGFGYWLARSPVIASFTIIMSMGAAALFLMMGLATAIFRVYPDLMARFISKNDTAYHRKVLSIIKEKYPDKYGDTSFDEAPPTLVSETATSAEIPSKTE